MKNHSLQSSSFAGINCPSEVLITADGDVRLIRNWLSPSQARQDFQQLRHDLQWQQSVLRIYGMQRPIPRLNAWYGEAGCGYRYSGVAFEPLPWTNTLMRIRDQLQSQLGVSFNSVLANLYRDGRDSVAWHSDDEPELGTNPVIASVSLGAERRFTLKHKFRKDINSIAMDLPDASLMVMSGATQQYWVHQVGKTTKPVAERINLTFRFIYQ